MIYSKLFKSKILSVLIFVFVVLIFISLSNINYSNDNIKKIGMAVLISKAAKNNNKDNSILHNSLGEILKDYKKQINIVDKDKIIDSLKKNKFNGKDLKDISRLSKIGLDCNLDYFIICVYNYENDKDVLDIKLIDCNSKLFINNENIVFNNDSELKIKLEKFIKTIMPEKTIKESGNIPIKVLSYRQETIFSEELIIGYVVTSESIVNVDITLNGKSIKNEDKSNKSIGQTIVKESKKPKEDQRIQFTQNIKNLIDGDNKIVISIETESGNYGFLNLIIKKVPEPKGLGKTWIVSIGIDNYKNVPVVRYATFDAKDFYEVMISSWEKIEEKEGVEVEKHLFINEDATKKNLENFFLQN